MPTMNLKADNVESQEFVDVITPEWARSLRIALEDALTEASKTAGFDKKVKGNLLQLFAELSWAVESVHFPQVYSEHSTARPGASRGQLISSSGTRRLIFAQSNLSLPTPRLSPEVQREAACQPHGPSRVVPSIAEEPACQRRARCRRACRRRQTRRRCSCCQSCGGRGRRRKCRRQRVRLRRRPLLQEGARQRSSSLRSAPPCRASAWQTSSTPPDIDAVFAARGAGRSAKDTAPRRAVHVRPRRRPCPAWRERRRARPRGPSNVAKGATTAAVAAAEMPF